MGEEGESGDSQDQNLKETANTRFHLDIGVRGAPQVEGGQLCALDGRHVQRLGVEVVLQLEVCSEHTQIYRKYTMHKYTIKVVIIFPLGFPPIWECVDYRNYWCQYNAPYWSQYNGNTFLFNLS